MKHYDELWFEQKACSRVLGLAHEIVQDFGCHPRILVMLASQVLALYARLSGAKAVSDTNDALLFALRAVVQALRDSGHLNVELEIVTTSPAMRVIAQAIDEKMMRGDE